MRFHIYTEFVNRLGAFSALSGLDVGGGATKSLRGGPVLLVRRLVDLHGWTGAHKVLVAVDVVDPRNGRPELGLGSYERLRGQKNRKTRFHPTASLNRQIFDSLYNPLQQITFTSEFLFFLPLKYLIEVKRDVCFLLASIVNPSN